MSNGSKSLLERVSDVPPLTGESVSSSTREQGEIKEDHPTVPSLPARPSVSYRDRYDRPRDYSTYDDRRRPADPRDDVYVAPPRSSRPPPRRDWREDRGSWRERDDRDRFSYGRGRGGYSSRPGERAWERRRDPWEDRRPNDTYVSSSSRRDLRARSPRRSPPYSPPRYRRSPSPGYRRRASPPYSVSSRDYDRRGRSRSPEETPRRRQFQRDGSNDSYKNENRNRRWDDRVQGSRGKRDRSASPQSQEHRVQRRRRSSSAESYVQKRKRSQSPPPRRVEKLPEQTLASPAVASPLRIAVEQDSKRRSLTPLSTAPKISPPVDTQPPPTISHTSSETQPSAPSPSVISNLPTPTVAPAPLSRSPFVSDRERSSPVHSTQPSLPWVFPKMHAPPPIGTLQYPDDMIKSQDEKKEKRSFPDKQWYDKQWERTRKERFHEQGRIHQYRALCEASKTAFEATLDLGMIDVSYQSFRAKADGLMQQRLEADKVEELAARVEV